MDMTDVTYQTVIPTVKMGQESRSEGGSCAFGDLTSEGEDIIWVPYVVLTRLSSTSYLRRNRKIEIQ